ncbi:uncharacterized protein LOC110410395 isoform X2 [Herrania umbratica]|uniref:Uncharacterized protein LOC110410395 isoform X2 n=1 Tax=Herrania umbratica TaxID=108875 RepID=A0A6J0ZLN7_9ROSI|nr:uncharacterized protein LOC110410395 isoform X2 [Herrania umbratica]
MAGSTILSRLSSARLNALALKLKSNKSVLPTISPLKPSSQSLVSSSVKRITGISRYLLAFITAHSVCGLAMDKIFVITVKCTSFLKLEKICKG